MGRTQISCIFFLIIWFCLPVFSAEHKELTIQNLRTKILDNQKKTSQPLLQLLTTLDVKHNYSLPTIIAATQQQWLRPKDKERGQLEDVFFTKKDTCMPLFKNLGMLDTVYPSSTEYDYALILGVEVPLWAYQRVTYCAQLLEQKKISFKHLVILACQRPVNNEQKYFKSSEVKTETDLMKILLEKTELKKILVNLPITFIDMPMKKGKENYAVPPNTRDTVQQWLKQKPQPGKCIVFSNQPFVGYQDAVLQETLPKSFTVDTVGFAPKEKVNVSLYLDTLARWLYEKQFGLLASKY